MSQPGGRREHSPDLSPAFPAPLHPISNPAFPKQSHSYPIIREGARSPHPLYPDRAWVIDSAIDWRVPWLEYEPVVYTADVVRANDRTLVSGGWADPAVVRAAWKPLHTPLKRRLHFSTYTHPRTRRMHARSHAHTWLISFRPLARSLHVLTHTPTHQPAHPRTSPRTPQADALRDEWQKRVSFEGALIFDAFGAPLNPRGRTGMRERGLLGKWGPNHAADPIVTRWHPETKKLQDPFSPPHTPPHTPLPCHSPPHMLLLCPPPHPTTAALPMLLMLRCPPRSGSQYVVFDYAVPPT